MAKVSLYLDNRSLKKDGTAPIKIIIRNRDTQAHLPTGVAIPPQCWKNDKVTKGKGVADATALNQKLKVLLAKVNVFVDDLCGLKSNMSASAIRDRVLSYLSGRTATASDATLMSVFREYMEQIENVSSRESFGIVYRYMERALKKPHQISLDDIDIEWLKELKKTMLEGTKDCKPLANNTMINYIWVLRAVYRYAQKKGYCSNAEYPFADLKLQKKPVKKRALEENKLKGLFTLTEKQIVGKPLRRKNVWLCVRTLRLVFMLCGINIRDLYYLTEKDIVNGRLQTLRGKTGVPIDIKIEPEARELINQLKSPDGRLIGKVAKRNVRNTTDFLDTYAKFILPNLSVYYIRHSWASTAANLDIPDRTLSMGLAHTFGNAMDNVYITNDNRKLDKANRKIIDFVLQRGEFAPKSIEGSNDNKEGQ